ncbi:MAG TPA: hypothetical protein ENJ55_06335 [Rhizobiales bacterium]|nr:hypothetical protein [Hyphomicrobiales bacterium]
MVAGALGQFQFTILSPRWHVCEAALTGTETARAETARANPVAIKIFFISSPSGTDLKSQHHPVFFRCTMHLIYNNKPYILPYGNMSGKGWAGRDAGQPDGKDAFLIK